MKKSIMPGDKVLKIKELVENHCREDFIVDTVSENGFVLLKGEFDDRYKLRSNVDELVHSTRNKMLKYFIGFGECVVLEKFKFKEIKWFSELHINMEIDLESRSLYLELNFEEIEAFFKFVLELGKFINSKSDEIEILNQDYFKDVRERENDNLNANQRWNDHQDSLPEYTGYNENGMADGDPYNPNNW